MSEVFHRICRFCESSCGLRIEAEPESGRLMVRQCHLAYDVPSGGACFNVTPVEVEPLRGRGGECRPHEGAA